MSISIVNNTGSIDIFDDGLLKKSLNKKGLTVEQVDTTRINFKYGRQVVYFNYYANIAYPTSTSIDDLMNTLAGYGEYNITKDYNYAIAESEVLGHQSVFKFGSNPDIGTSEETIWQEGGLYPWASVDAAAGVVKVSSSSAQDALVQQVETATVVGTITGDGTAAVVLTSALVVDNEITLAVDVVTDDTAAQVAAKIRTAMDIVGITEFYTVGGTGADIVLTAVDGAANDATLNISIDNGTCTGLTTAATSADTTAGVLGTGAHTVTIYGLNNITGMEQNETVTLKGQTAVNSQLQYKRVNRMIVNTAGTGLANAGIVYVGTGTVTTGKPAVVWSSVAAGRNQTLQAIWTVPTGKTFHMTSFFTSTNSNKGDIVNIYFRPAGELFQIKANAYLFSSNLNKRFDFPLHLTAGTDIDCRAIGTATGAAIQFSFEGWYE